MAPVDESFNSTLVQLKEGFDCEEIEVEIVSILP